MDLKKIAGKVAGTPAVVPDRTRVEDFLVQAGLTGDALDALWDLLGSPETEYGEDDEPEDASTEPEDFEIPGVGKVTAWIGECSEGADRGGYVRYFKVHGFTDSEGEPVVLEADEGPGELLFNGRMGWL